MQFEPGRRLGPFEVLAPLGAGGMGEVYRALDTRLGREVALKVLPDRLARDSERLARFDREARTLASLSHPHIAGLHGLEEHGGVRLLVMELVRGTTLADRLARGALPVTEALELLRQLALALEAAHRAGIVHRDLKPANISVTADGTLKVLDFGLAKALAADFSGVPAMEAATLTREGTAVGIAVGTPAYMSPEQARGEPVDERTDVWAFGCVAYAMLAGEPPFKGRTTSDTLAAVLTGEPDWRLVISRSPRALPAVLQRCLRKDPDRRMRDIADVRIEIEEAAGAPPAAGAPGGGSRRARAALLAAFAAGALVAGAALLLWPRRDQAPPFVARRLSIVPAPDAPLMDTVGRGFKAMALSPRGTHLAYLVAREGRTQIHLRALDELEAKPLPGTEGAVGPFFSYDGDWLGFAAEGKLKKIPIRGGQPQVICDAPTLRGASWGEDDTILFVAQSPGPLVRVAAAGGSARPVAGVSETEFPRWPVTLPGGRAVLYSTSTDSGREEERTVAVALVDTGERRTLVEGATDPRYSRTGHLIYARAGSVLAAPFDLRRLELNGPALPVVDDVRMDSSGSGLAYYDVDDTGTLVYVPGYPRPPDRVLSWMDRQGRSQRLLAEPRPYGSFALSPDGSRLALGIVDGRTVDIWIQDLARGTRTRLTFDGINLGPSWSPDGRRIAFVSLAEGGRIFRWMPADGSRPPEALPNVRGWLLFPAFSPDGKHVVFGQQLPGTGFDILTASLEGERNPQPLVATTAQEVGAVFSPDSRFIVYESDESGRREVYVHPFPGPGARTAVSREGGSEPAWSRDGRELFYRERTRLMAVSVRTQPELALGAPRVVFEVPEWAVEAGMFNYNVAPDGDRFVVATAVRREPLRLQFVVAPGWEAELRERLRGKGR